jgi:hypothetical protein
MSTLNLEQLIQSETNQASVLLANMNYFKTKFDAEEKENTKLRRVNQCLSERNKIIEQNLKEIQNELKEFQKNEKVSIGKDYFELSKSQKYKIQDKARESLTSTNRFLNIYGLQIGNVNIIPSNPDLLKCALVIQREYEKTTKELQDYLYLKDSTNLSDYAYDVTRKRVAQDWPSLHSIKSFRKEMNEQLEEQIKSNSKGYFVDIEKTIKTKIREYHEKYERERSTFSIKLSADSTNIGKKLKVLNVTLTLVDDVNTCMSQHGHQIIGMFNVSNEDYEEVKLCVKEIFEQVEHIGNQIQVDERKLDLEFYFVADWKMLAIVTGLQAANGNYCCIWCVCHKENFLKRKFCLWRHLPSCPDQGRLQKSLLPSNIPLTNVLIDTLHLFLRIGEQLVNKVITECRNADGLAKKDPYKKNKHRHLKKFVNFMKGDCKLSYNLFSTSKSAVQGTSLRGADLQMFFERVNVTKLLPKYRFKNRLQTLITEFYEIFKLLKALRTPARVLQKRTSAWIKKYRIVCDNKSTPYMHVFHRHLTTQIKRHGDIYLFNLEGLEKQNDVSTKAYFRSSNMKTKGIKQVFTKFLRINTLEKILQVCNDFNTFIKLTFIFEILYFKLSLCILQTYGVTPIRRKKVQKSNQQSSDTIKNTERRLYDSEIRRKKMESKKQRRAKLNELVLRPNIKRSAASSIKTKRIILAIKYKCKKKTSSSGPRNASLRNTDQDHKNEAQAEHSPYRESQKQTDDGVESKIHRFLDLLREHNLRQDATKLQIDFLQSNNWYIHAERAGFIIKMKVWLVISNIISAHKTSESNINRNSHQDPSKDNSFFLKIGLFTVVKQQQSQMNV